VGGTSVTQEPSSGRRTSLSTKPEEDTRELILFRAQHEALIRVLGRKRGAALIRETVDLLTAAQGTSNVFEIGTGRSPTEETAAAIAWYRSATPAFVACLLMA
jgi:hypothetical protein